MTPQEALNYIHQVSWRGSIPGLDRTRELLHRLGNPQDRLKFIHIAGTNGKGSTAAMLSTILKEAGYRTGLYTSPYIVRFHERMQVNNMEISDAELAQITQFVKPHAEAMADHPTEFELVTAIAMVYFARHSCDIVVLEVGMGGELDSTNVISTPEVAVICNIGLDHTQTLGSTLEEIAACKAGIIKPGGSVVAYRSEDAAHRVLELTCAARGAHLYTAPFEALVPVRHNLAGQTFHFQTYHGLALPLLGAHQLRNAAVALTTIGVLQKKGWQITPAHVRSGLQNVRWPGRLEVLLRQPLFLADGGHNPQCMAALVQSLQDYLSGRKIIALTGVLADKDYIRMYQTIAPLVHQFITVTPDCPRSLPAQELAHCLACFGKPVEAAADVAAGVARALALAQPGDAIVAFGSLYMMGQLRRCVQQSTAAPQ